MKGVALNLKQSFEKWVYFGWLVDSIDPDADHGMRVLMTSAYLHPGVEDSIELDNDGWTTRQVIRRACPSRVSFKPRRLDTFKEQNNKWFHGRGRLGFPEKPPFWLSQDARLSLRNAGCGWITPLRRVRHRVPRVSARPSWRASTDCDRGCTIRSVFCG